MVKKMKDGTGTGLEPHRELMKPFDGVAHLAGLLSYSWRDQAGAIKEHSVRFRVVVQLVYLSSGGPGPVTGRYETMLRPSGHNYLLRLPISQRVDPRTTTRFLVRLGLPRTSQHHFNLQLRTTRGETVESEPIVLDGLLPPAAAEQLKEEASRWKNPPAP
jgi:hypothetical protein